MPAAVGSFLHRSDARGADTERKLADTNAIKYRLSRSISASFCFLLLHRIGSKLMKRENHLMFR